MDGHKKLLRNASTLCLAIVPFAQLGTARASGSLDALTAPLFATLVACILSTLCLIRACNLALFRQVSRYGLGGQGPVPAAVTRAVVLAANQKTLPICLAVLAQLESVIGSGVALATVASVLAHFTQVILDSVLVQWWQRRDRRQAAGDTVSGPAPL